MEQDPTIAYLNRAIKQSARGDLIAIYSRILRRAFTIKVKNFAKPQGAHLWHFHRPTDLMAFKDFMGVDFTLNTEGLLHGGVLELLARVTDVRVVWLWSISPTTLEPFKNIGVLGKEPNVVAFYKVYNTLYQSILNKWRLDKVNRVFRERRSEYVLHSLESLVIKNAKLLEELRAFHSNTPFNKKLDKFVTHTIRLNYKAYRTTKPKYLHAISKSFSPNRVIY